MENIELSINDLDNRLKTSERRIDDLENKTDKLEMLTLAVQKLAISMEQMTKDQSDFRGQQNELARRLLEVERAPAQQKANEYDDIKKTVVHCIISALVGAALVFLGLSM